MDYNIKQKGFTLVETLVVIFVFSIIALVVSAVLIRALDIERRSFASQAIQENILAVVELMAKEIRVSIISDQDNNCSGSASSTLTISHPQEGAIVYRLNALGVIERVVGGTIYFLSSNEVTFNSLGFCILGTTSPADDQTARITILLSVQSNNISGQTVATKIQTTVTSRDIAAELQN